ncbi:hypothetical protein PHISP_02282 [Aspergillus sp. HF37]|nr:hypothetical protein PHISP_02282 [Aspergillus sp. HF37]
MRPSRPPSRRKALHERTPSESNEPAPPSSLRLVYDMDSGSDDLQDVYSSTPYPTKPAHVLLPAPGKGQESVPVSTYDSAETSENSTAILFSDSSRPFDSSLMDQSMGDWELSSTADAPTPSQSWEDNPSSTIPDFDSPAADDRKGNNSEGSFSDDGVVTLPTAAPTIKTVVPESSPATGPPSSEVAASSNSSPNVLPIGPPSSPNYAATDSSSMNVVRIGASSNPDSRRSCSLESMASFGTVVRNHNAAHWIHSSSPERSITRSPSLRSSPPYQPAASVRSASTRPTRERSLSRSLSRSATSSSRSGPPSDAQAIIDSGVFIQYPTIRAPSSSGSWVDTSYSSFPDTSSQDLGSVDSRGRFHSHLSTVPSQSGEYDGRVLSPVDESFDQGSGDPSRSSAALARQTPASSLAWLPTDPPHKSRCSQQHIFVENSSLKSNRRPGTGSSFLLNAVPAWARIYYRCDERTINSALSLVDGGLPPYAKPPTPKPPTPKPPTPKPPTPKPNAVGRSYSPAWTETSRPAPLREIHQGSPRSRDPTDPRTHWVDGPEPEAETPASPELPASWSPHLYPDRNVIQTADTLWTAPSVDSAAEPTLGRRNVQVYMFCFGFICPLAWFVASFLHLPPKPEMDIEEPWPQVEFAYRMRLLDMSRRRHDNARWWRNLNRWMTPLGAAIIVIVIVLAAVGTTTGF